ncbi:hypothetical protein SAMN05216188_115130 [Lentzea xinjiangensis]|uniref:Uncharacterized protein n=1 Tax=Lentzea xinjiangensis TaxID=402600 RepID=A0A1H9S0G7_9PSEU|nr:hypothetical protein SAMN05216188_115130 [Lentzea xinjiangensis]
MIEELARTTSEPEATQRQEQDRNVNITLSHRCALERQA